MDFFSIQLSKTRPIDMGRHPLVKSLRRKGAENIGIFPSKSRCPEGVGVTMSIGSWNKCELS